MSEQLPPIPRGTGALEPNEAIVRTRCPKCSNPATVWLWLEGVREPFDLHPRRMAFSGAITDLVHDDPRAAQACGGLTP